MDRREFLGTAAATVAAPLVGTPAPPPAKRRLHPTVAGMVSRGLDPTLLMRDIGFYADNWQKCVLRSESPRQLLLCNRQAGKSTTTAVLALHTALFQSDSLVLLLSPSLRQSGELFKKVAAFYSDLGKPVAPVQETALTLTLANGSRIISLPGTPDTIRGFSGVRLLIVDEAAMTSDDLFVAVTPMLAVSRGRLVALSTPLGKRGWFFEAWEGGDPLWERIKVTAWDCPRITKDFLESERRSLGDRWFRQEYECSFEESVDQLFSNESINNAFDDDGTGIDLDPFTY